MTRRDSTAVCGIGAVICWLLGGHRGCALSALKLLLLVGIIACIVGLMVLH